MQFLTLAAAFATVASAASVPRSNTETDTTQLVVADAVYDGQCFYPKATGNFDVQSYLGTWYQVAGYPFGPTAGARCVTANYSLNNDGTVKVVNTAQIGPQAIVIEGTATPVSQSYAKAGAFKVEFPSTPQEACPGPNYIVQKFSGDFAIVQTQNWATLFVLSRERHPSQAKIDKWIAKSVSLGSDPSKISKFDQSGC
ncbi:Calycin-like protein [Coprinopsis sp. MPI-PUGE-AT-0042]|nr:Calycin-like protein [Coprinopsis sp. MPI-PUGE-AT-0042]